MGERVCRIINGQGRLRMALTIGWRRVLPGFGEHASQVVVLRHSGCSCESKCCWFREMGLLGFRKPLDLSRILLEGWFPRPGDHDRVLYGKISPSWLWSDVEKTQVPGLGVLLCSVWLVEN